MSKSSFQRAIQVAGTNTRFPVMDLVRKEPEIAAVISKLIPAREAPQYGTDGNRQPSAPNIGVFKELSQQTAQSAADSQTVMQLLPDMELAAQILVSSIIAPKDMTTTELTYTHAEGLMAPEVSSAMIALVKDHFEQTYKIEPLLPKILRDVLFETGSYAVAVIPENSLDEAINSHRQITMESLSSSINPDGSVKPLGLLGPSTRNQPTAERANPGLAMEALQQFQPDTKTNGRVRFEHSLAQPVDDTYLTVTDNPSLLKIPQINQKIREQKILQSVGSRALEGISRKMTDREMTSLVYKDRQFAYKPISKLKTQEQLARRTVGNPLVLHLPSESVIPVYVPGSKEEQIGFFVLIDADGNPVARGEDTDHYHELSQRLNSTSGSFPSAMLNKAKGMMQGFDLGNRDHLDYSAKAYGEMVEQDLLARLRNGVYGNGVAIAKKEEVYRIMFARALAKQHTQLLFMPTELVTYFAFRYNSNGIGRSLLDEMQILNSLRAMMLFANVMSSVKNSIGRTQVKLKLDESDPDPKKTIEIAMHEILRSRQQNFPLGMNSPSDLVDWLQKSGMEFTFEGHPGLPDVGIDFSETASNYVKPDAELEESLRKRAIMATGLSPETVDATFQAEFATSVVANNVLLAKRVIQLQEQFTPLLSDHMRKYIMNSEELIKGLTDVLVSNFDKLRVEQKETKDQKTENNNKTDTAVKKVDQAIAKQYVVNEFLQEFILSFEVTLPKPNSVTLENQLAALETYTKALDMTLDAWVSDKFFTAEMGGEVAGQVATIKEVLKAYYIRQWMSENGVMTELAKLTTLDGAGKPMFDVYQSQVEHIGALTKSLTQFMVKLQPIKDAADAVLQDKVGEVEAAAPTDSGGDDAGGGDDLGGGGDDFNFDEPGADGADAGGDAPADDAAAADAPAEEPAAEEPAKDDAADKPADDKKDDAAKDDAK